MDCNYYLGFTRRVCLEALDELFAKTHYHRSLPLACDTDDSREFKSQIDHILEEKITNSLMGTGIPILSEESSSKQTFARLGLQWIVDPLDGTVNWSRGDGPSAVSIALFEDGRPLFGVIAEYPSRHIFWGGEQFGAFVGNKQITVANFSSPSHRILYSGFPSRTNFLDISHLEVFDHFHKIRMLGCASISLAKVALQLGDCYYENQVKIWDVAAGLALIEGAGGCCKVDWPQRESVCLSVVAGNNESVESLCGSGGMFENWSVL